MPLGRRCTSLVKLCSNFQLSPAFIENMYKCDLSLLDSLYLFYLNPFLQADSSLIKTMKYYSVFFAKLLPRFDISLCQIVFTIKSLPSENYNNCCAVEILIYCNLKAPGNTREKNMET